MQVSAVYSVPLTFCDTEISDTLKQTVVALEILSKTVDGVFANISQRVGLEKGRLNNLMQRVEVTAKKVQSIAGTTRSTTTFASAKYPILDSKLQYWGSFYEGMELSDAPILNEDDNLEPVLLPDQSAHKGKGGKGLFNLFTATAPVNQEFSSKFEAKEGLGKLPSFLPAVGSVLLFNSSENPYKKYNNLDNLLGVDSVFVNESRKSLAEAPNTLINGDKLPAIEKLDMNYRPAPGEISKFVVPTNINLPSIASDIIFDSNFVLPSIAPYAAPSDFPLLTDVSSSFSSLPSVTGPNASPIKSASSPPPPPSSNNKPPPPPPSNTNKPPPPPPPSNPNTNIKSPNPPTSSNPPPPPPPPTNVPVSNNNNNNNSNNNNNAPPPPRPPPANVPIPSDAIIVPQRGNLLDAIKNPDNLKKLKSVKENESEKKEEKVVEKASKKLTMQEEMLQRLARKRNAISGRDDEDVDKEREKRTTMKSAAIAVTASNKLGKKLSKDDDGEEEGKKSSFMQADKNMPGLKALLESRKKDEDDDDDEGGDDWD